MSRKIIKQEATFPLLEYENGTVRRTWVQGVKSASKDSVTFSDVLGDSMHCGEIEDILLTSYIVDEQWLLDHFLSPSTSITLIASTTLNIQAADSRVARIIPEMPKPKVQIMHSKLILIFYKESMRFVVCTGNLTNDDWSILQNSVYIQDFRRDKDKKIVYPANDFSMSLAYALHDMSVPYKVIGYLNNVDFFKAAAHIVTSVPTGGKHHRQHLNMKEYGMERLAKIIKDRYPDRNKDGNECFFPDARMYCTTSSLGPLDYRWMRDMYLCAHGMNPKEYRMNWLKTIPDNMIDIAVAYHTDKQMQQCRYGDRCRPYFYARPSVYAERDFPRSSMFYIESYYLQTMVHSKVILTRVEEDQAHGWMYMGSHNFTPAAWGRMRVNSRDTTYYNNYEFGVVLFDIDYKNVADGASDQEAKVTWQDRRLDLPFKYVWKPYSHKDSPYFNKGDDDITKK